MIDFKKNYYMSSVVWVGRGLVLGILIGFFCYILTRAVTLANIFRTNHPFILLLMPIAALCIAFVNKISGDKVTKSGDIAMDIINERVIAKTNPGKITKNKSVSPMLGPVIFITTLITHLVGGSNGKEGAGVQIGTSLACLQAKLERKLFNRQYDSNEMETWLIVGAGGAFGALFNAPITGTMFGLHVSFPNSNRFDSWVPCLSCNIASCYVSHLLGASVIEIPNIQSIEVTIPIILICMVLGIIAGLIGRLFIYTTHFFSQLKKKFSSNAYIRAIIFGTIIAIVAISVQLLTGESWYNGMSLELLTNAKWYSFLVKIVLTALATAGRFSGGEVVPALVIGASAFRPLATFLPIPAATLAMLGSVGVLSGSSNLPLVGTLMAFEVFGFTNPLLIFIVCSFSYISSGNFSIYQHQLKI